MNEITVIGGGVAGLVASIACAEGGAPVRLLEAHETLGGRGRSTDGPYVANFGPHVLYANGTLWDFMRERDLLPPMARPPLTGVLFRAGGKRRRTPPIAFTRAVLRLWRTREAPDDVSFRTWVAERCDERSAELLSRSCGVFAFHHDPGELAAGFVWERFRQAFLDLPLKARYTRGGWGALIDRLEAGARAAGVQIETGARVTELPADGPTIVATELPEARALLDDPTLDWPSGRTVALDLGLRKRRGDAFVVWDLDEAGWIETYSVPDKTLAPAGHALVQAQMPLRPGESTEDGERRLEALLDVGFRGWRERVAFRRRQLLDGRSGALDLPGTSWRDRPVIDRGDGVFLCGDSVAAPGLLSDPAVTSAVEAARLAVAQAALRPEISRL
ncbi:MAG TPA: NAD(P)-binding protein [Conexibacter sp.]|jgi:phytoene dehydrogenase-like protein|nr:NAD(P)-binding protein [Conexibacter sp.]